MTWVQPIYDRTILDIIEVKDLASRIVEVGWSNTTQVDKDLWNGFMKGSLNHTDLTRIDNNIYHLADFLADIYDIVVDIDRSNPTWNNDVYVLLGHINRIRDNVVAIEDATYQFYDNPEIGYENPPNFEGINNIEESLDLLFSEYNRMLDSIQYCGRFNCGSGTIL